MYEQEGCHGFFDLTSCNEGHPANASGQDVVAALLQSVKEEPGRSPSLPTVEDDEDGHHTKFDGHSPGDVTKKVRDSESSSSSSDDEESMPPPSTSKLSARELRSSNRGPMSEVHRGNGPDSVAKDARRGSGEQPSVRRRDDIKLGIVWLDDECLRLFHGWW